MEKSDIIENGLNNCAKCKVTYEICGGVKMPFKIVRNDITKMNVDVVVNTANEEPIYSLGVDSAIYKAAGEKELLAARQKIGYMNEGEVAITSGYKLLAKYIIHAVSPLFIDGNEGEEEKLRNCYRKSLRLAHDNGCKSIAFPLIATGSFGYPKEEGMRVAIDEINAFLLKHEMLVYLVVFDSETTKMGKSLYPDLKAYIDNNYVEEKKKEEYGFFGRLFGSERSVPGKECREDELIEVSADKCMLAWESDDEDQDLDLTDDSYDEFIEEKDRAINERMKHLSDTFQQYLFYLMGEKKLDNVSVYKRAIIDKRQFSKIKNNENYHPDKATALRLCVGAMLNLDETKDLLARAGYALSPCDKRDIIFSYFIEKGIYDVMEIDITLEEHGLPCFIE